MTTITLPADLESRLAAEATRRGTTVEEVVVEKLRHQFPAPQSEQAEGGIPPASGGSLYGLIKDHIGTVSGPTDLSQDTGKRFGELVEEDYRRQQEALRQRLQAESES
jgi:hypothetical protein